MNIRQIALFFAWFWFDHIKKNMKTQNKPVSSKQVQKEKKQKETGKRNRDSQSVMAEMKIRSGRPNKRK